LKTTLHNLDRNATRAAPELGRCFVGDLPDKDVLTLLEQFSRIDDLQNFEADPEILLESARAKRVVRVSRGRLCLYNPGKMLDAALVLTGAEIIAEMSFVVPALRAAVEQIAHALPRQYVLPEAPRPIVLLRRESRIGLAAAALGLGAYLFSAVLSGETTRPGDRFVPMADSPSREAVETKLLGVYMTGNQRGDHGIVVDSGGTMRLFQLNEPEPPLLIRDDYRIGHIEGTLCLISHQPGGPLWIGPDNTLTYCGETYRRIQ
jgi:hypothetical protein